MLNTTSSPVSSSISSLETRIRQAAEAYYLSGEPLMFDQEFDALTERLRSLDPENPILSRVGWGMTPYKRKVKLPIHIDRSLPKVRELPDWTRTSLVSLKADGISAILEYENGVVKTLATRGDGESGIEVTPKAHLIRGISERPGTPEAPGFTGVVRGELIIREEVFEAHLQENGRKDGKSYRNPRNAVAGIVNARSLESVEFVEFVAHPDLRREACPLVHRLSSVPGDSAESPEELRDLLFLEDAGVPIDGLVIQNPENPGERVAYKFGTEFVETVVKEVLWEESSRSRLNPIIIFEPVDLYGTRCQRASAFTLDYVEENRIGPGAVVRITKANEIIPFIVEVVQGGEEVSLPEGEWYRDGKYAFRADGKDYQRSLIAFIQHQFSFYGMKTPWERLFEPLGISSFSELGEVDPDSLPGKFEPIAKKLREGLSDREFFSSFSLYGVGRDATARLHRFLPRFIEAFTLEENERQNEVETICDESGVNSIVRARLLDRDSHALLAEAFVSLKWNREEDDPAPEEGEGLDLTVVITGALSRPRKEVERALKSRGARIRSSVTGGTDLLITNTPSSGSRKNKAARDLGIRILTEVEAKNELGAEW